MRYLFRIWKLGARVFGRWLLFAIGLAFCAIPFRLVAAILSEFSWPWVTLLAMWVILSVPLVFFFAARWTGILQAHDHKHFVQLEKERLKKEKFSNKTIDTYP